MKIRACAELFGYNYEGTGQVEDIIEIADSDLEGLSEQEREGHIQDKMYDLLMPQVDVAYQHTDFWYEVL